jgi:hypothetical protein
VLTRTPAQTSVLSGPGVANYHRDLVKTNLSTDYRRELAWWLELMSA